MSILTIQASVHIWEVNTGVEYQESGGALTYAELEALLTTQPMMPKRASRAAS
jgi:hypothetical protein